MQFRRLNDAGLTAFREYLNALRADPTLAPPVALLTDGQYSEALSAPIAAEPEPFPNRMAFARWLHDAATAADTLIPRADAGFWAWLSLALFDQVCPADGTGRRKVREDAWYIPALKDARRHYRHTLFGPYSIYHLHRDNPDVAKILLFGPFTNLGHFQYQLASRQDLLANPKVMEAATALYLEPVPHFAAGLAYYLHGKEALSE